MIVPSANGACRCCIAAPSSRPPDTTMLPEGSLEPDGGSNTPIRLVNCRRISPFRAKCDKPFERTTMARVSLALAPLLLAAAVFASVAGARTASPWAGLTKTQAIRKAENGWLAAILAFKPKTSPAALAKTRAQMDAVTPKTRKVTCSGQRLWQVTWPKSDPAYVSRKTIMFSCG